MSDKVAILISGGVDSSTAAYLLKKEGFKVTGVYLKMFKSKFENYQDPSVRALEVCNKLDISLKILDIEETFKEKIVDYFIESYRNAFTPNPCVVCNKNIKFGLFMKYALENLESDYISSGHYAIVENTGNRFLLKKGIDPKKDQSYVLYSLKQDVLSKMILPLGKFKKTEIREIASKISDNFNFGKESEDLCFVEGDYKGYLKGFIDDKDGFIVNKKREILGEHKGIHNYTVGQREGLRISNSTPLYVIDIDPVKNIIIVGKKEEAFSRGLIADNVNFIPFDVLDKKLEVSAKVRYKGEEKFCVVEPCNDNIKVTFNEPQFAITRGQSIVFYDKDYVVGGGIIREVF